MPYISLNVRLTLAGPILTRSTSSGQPGIDAAMARTNEKFYLPYSLVRGRLRQSLEELADAGAGGILPEDLNDWFGPRMVPAHQASSYEPERARLRFEDFLALTAPTNQAPVRVRTRMDVGRGAVDEGALQMIESPYAPGESVVFAGTIAFDADPIDGAKVRKWVELGLRWTAGFGSGSTLGFGRLLKVEISESPRSQSPAADFTADDAGLLGLQVRPLAPFCVARYVADTNLFESNDVIPGSVLRGVLASRLKRLAGQNPNDPIDVAALDLPVEWKELGAHFDSVRITHAFPAKGDAAPRPVVPPLSLVKAKFQGEAGTNSDKVRWFDVALGEGPLTLGQPLRAPAFAIDWKHGDGCDVRSCFRWQDHDLKRELRVRTGINPGTRRAQDAELFAYELVVPGAFVWLARLDLSRVPPADRPAVSKQLQSLVREGLTGLGKTKAAAQVTVVPDADIRTVFPAKTSDPPRDCYVVTLQTPALLCDPTTLDEASGEPELQQAYQETWDDLSRGPAPHGAFELVRFFARQRLAGGYLFLRYQPGKPYNPFLVTEPGSVFVLRARAGHEDAAALLIDEWRKYGLPLPHWAKTLYGDHWKTCPFRTVDGFGEVAIDLPCHRDEHRAPPGGTQP